MIASLVGTTIVFSFVISLFLGKPDNPNWRYDMTDLNAEANDWIIWGDDIGPVKEGLTESEARIYLDQNSEDPNIYAENGNGDQIETHNGPIVKYGRGL